MTNSVRRILVTGSNGFIGKSLCLRLSELSAFDVLRFTRTDDFDTLAKLVAKADVVVHLAGVNRPISTVEFQTGNVDLTSALCKQVAAEQRTSGRIIPIIFASSTQAELTNPYGASKRQAEEVLEAHHKSTGLPICIYRLPGVFGKWCKPNYNSVVATFCYNTAHDLPLEVHASSKRLDLVYIDDVVSSIITSLANNSPHKLAVVEPCYEATLEDLATTIQSFKGSRQSGITARVGVGLTRALHATYLSYLSSTQFSYPLHKNVDERGEFVEMLKTEDSGQFSYFTAHPGITRGGHYHHTKTEKFLVLRGTARFGFRHMVTDERFELTTHGGSPEVVETIPGWTHDITNIGTDELVVMLWANEIYDRAKPDTTHCKV